MDDYLRKNALMLQSSPTRASEAKEKSGEKQTEELCEERKENYDKEGASKWQNRF